MTAARKRRVGFWLCLLAALACWFFSVSQSNRILSMPAAGVRYQADGGVTLGDWENAQKAAEKKQALLPDATLWRELPGESLEDSARLKNGFAEILELSGNPELILSHPMHHGSLPARGDTAGCAVSMGLADALWGGTDVIGKTLLRGGRPFIVRGVYEDDAPSAMFQTTDEKTSFPNLELSFEDGVNSADQTRSFLTSYSLPPPEGILDGGLWTALAGLLALLPGWVLGFAALAYLLRGVLAARRSPALCALAAFASALAGGAVLWAVQMNTLPPVRFIPGKWSDFSFWSRLWESAVSDLSGLMRLTFTSREAALLGQVLACALFCLLSCFLFVLTAERLHTVRNPMPFAAAVLLSAYLLVLWLAQEGAVELPRAFWLALPAAALCRSAYRAWGYYLLGEGKPFHET
ncbi:ABC transporter permease [Anaeromassilibacillus senegalensis]|uniref:ABC transporter permease n=1 Tax=Anaeromassilibacillus senegalensis TaxID=1673717 RepID=UPI00068361A5|nr:ABC transporter permease [Anaeromassilibacillus senegalensis]